MSATNEIETKENKPKKKLQIVKCPFCEQDLDRNTEEFTKKATRYYHKECLEKMELEKKEKSAIKSKRTIDRDKLSPDERDRRDLLDYALRILNKNPERKDDIILITTQIKRIKEEHGYSYRGMLSTLQYFYEIRSESPYNSVGIGIVPFVYEEAKEWYTKRSEATKEFIKLKENKIELVTDRVLEIEINESRNKKKPIVDIGDIF